jgi:predicted RNA-binding Zn-ribbon protein involved in translation (DUF1610 family)
VDLLDLLRRQASRFHCPKCGETMADCGLEMVAATDSESLIRVTCTHCQDTRMIAVQVQGPEETVARPSVLDEPQGEAPAISTDEVLDVRLVLAQHQGDLTSLL